MGFQSLSCSSCGASEVRREHSRFACAFCGTSVIPRLLPGTLCGEGDGRRCPHRAESLCTVCARPLCDRHNDPKSVEWHAAVRWQRLFPDWDERDAADWARLSAPFQNFPVEGFEPFAWVGYARDNLYRAGLIEDEMLERMRGLAREVGGDADEVACRFESLCSSCEAELAARVENEVSAFADRWRRVAYSERLEAFAQEAAQQLRYLEAFLKRPVRKPEGLDAEPIYTDLAVGSRRSDWDRCGYEVKARLAILERLRTKVPA